MINIKKKLLSFPAMGEILKLSSELSLRVYVVGGVIRNALLKKGFARDRLDLDLVIDSPVVPFGAMLSRRACGSFFMMDEEREIGRVILKNTASGRVTIDISPVKGGCIENDLKLRDFTINSIAVDIASLKKSESLFFFDPLNGVSDISDRLIRKNSEEIFDDDPLRLIRAIRFETGHKLSIDPETELLLREKSEKIRGVSGERIRDEIFTVIRDGNGVDFFKRIKAVGVLGALFPEVEKMDMVKTGGKRNLSLWERSIDVLRLVDSLLQDTGKLFPDHEKEIEALLDREAEKPVNLRTLLFFTLLFHQTGKVTDRQEMLVSQSGFSGNEKNGGATVTSICRRIKLGKRSAGIVKSLTLWQARFSELHMDMDPAGMFRFFRETGELGVILTLAAVPDCWSLQGRSYSAPHAEVRARQLVHYYYSEFLKFKPLINGGDLKTDLGVKPGPLYKKILDRVDELSAGGQIKSKGEAITYVRRSFPGAGRK